MNFSQELCFQRLLRKLGLPFFGWNSTWRKKNCIFNQFCFPDPAWESFEYNYGLISHFEGDRGKILYQLSEHSLLFVFTLLKLGGIPPVVLGGNPGHGWTSRKEEYVHLKSICSLINKIWVKIYIISINRCYITQWTHLNNIQPRKWNYILLIGWNSIYQVVKRWPNATNNRLPSPDTNSKRDALSSEQFNWQNKKRSCISCFPPCFYVSCKSTTLCTQFYVTINLPRITLLSSKKKCANIIQGE